MSQEEVESKIEAEGIPAPYWDEVLRKDRAAYLDLLRTLDRVGLLRFELLLLRNQRAPRGRASIPADGPAPPAPARNPTRRVVHATDEHRLERLPHHLVLVLSLIHI